MALQVYEFQVQMTCDGCSNAVRNVLTKKEGVNNVQIDLANKKVWVTSSLPYDDLLIVIKKTGKACELLGIKK